jgi:hypothetical protein
MREVRTGTLVSSGLNGKILGTAQAFRFGLQQRLVYLLRLIPVLLLEGILDISQRRRRDAPHVIVNFDTGQSTSSRCGWL